MIEEYIAMQGIVNLVGFFVILVFGLKAINHLFTKSREYRKLLADMYVAGKIKQIATEENIDLIEELKEFAKFMKVKAIDCEAVDKTIERELQEKVAFGSEKKSKP